MPFASATVSRHLVRGALGLLALLGAFAGTALVSPFALVLLPLAFVAWRGCPTCWTVGLLATISGRGAACPPR